MVWSDQSSFPFFVIDNNGNIILTIDQQGLHLVGPNGRIDAIIDSSSFPTIRWATPSFSDAANIVFIPGLTAGQWMFAMQGNQYVSSYPGNPVMKGNVLIDEARIWLYNNTDPGQVALGGALSVGDHDVFLSCTDAAGVRRNFIALTDTFIDIYTQDAGGILKTEMSMDANGIIINTPGKPNHIYSNSTGFWSVSGKGWNDVVLTNGWTNFGGHYRVQAKFTTNGDVLFRGGAIPGNTADGTQVFAVPFLSWVPLAEVNIKPVSDGTNPAARIVIDAGGIARCYGFAGVGSIAVDGLGYSVTA